MDELPRIIKIGNGIGIIGGVLCIAFLAVFYESEPDTLTVLGLYMLAAVMFFALAGAFSKSSQWSWRMVVFMTYLTIGVVVGVTLSGIFNVYTGSVLTLLCALILLNLNFPGTKMWFSKAEC